MLIIDAHCDTLGKLGDGCCDLHIKKEKMVAPYIQVFAAFEGKNGNETARVAELIDAFDSLEGFKKIKKACDLETLDGCIGAILAVEGAKSVNSLEDIRRLYERGVRLLTLTWNGNNKIAGAALDNDEGLTAFGRDAVAECEKCGITVDLSHVGEKSFYDVLSVATRPVAVTHSNAFSVCGNKRNITDKQFGALLANGGVVGINFYPPFLSEGEASLDSVLRHIDRFLELGGENNVGIGTDFDGIDCLPTGVSGNESLYLLMERLSALYGEAVTEKIMGLNFLRLLKNNMH